MRSEKNGAISKVIFSKKSLEGERRIEQSVDQTEISSSRTLV